MPLDLSSPHRSCLRLMAGLSVAAGVSVASSAASAQSGAPAGRLSCHAEAGIAAAVGAQRPIECRFTPRRGPVQRYLGVVRSFGLDVGSIRRTTMSWRVYGPYARAPLGVLSGRYVVATGGANLLVGGTDNLVRLQPFSLHRGRGLNVAAGVTGFELVLRGRR